VGVFFKLLQTPSAFTQILLSLFVSCVTVGAVVQDFTKFLLVTSVVVSLLLNFVFVIFLLLI